ncbi:MAG: hypothetical protein ACI87E_004456 [Mariniblastus sp.]
MFHCHSCLAYIVESSGEPDNALRHRKSALEHIRSLHNNPSHPDFADCFAAQLIWNAAGREETADFAWLEKQYKLAKEIAVALKANPKAQFRHWRHRTDASWSLGSINMLERNHKAGLAYYHDTVKYANEMCEYAPDDWGYRCDRVVALHAYSNAFQTIGEFLHGQREVEERSRVRRSTFAFIANPVFSYRGLRREKIGDILQTTKYCFYLARIGAKPILSYWLRNRGLEVRALPGVLFDPIKTES